MATKSLGNLYLFFRRTNLHIFSPLSFNTPENAVTTKAQTNTLKHKYLYSNRRGQWKCSFSKERVFMRKPKCDHNKKKKKTRRGNVTGLIDRVPRRLVAPLSKRIWEVICSWREFFLTGFHHQPRKPFLSSFSSPCKVQTIGFHLKPVYSAYTDVPPARSVLFCIIF